MSDPKQNPQAVAAATGGKRAEQSIVIGVNDSTILHHNIIEAQHFLTLLDEEAEQFTFQTFADTPAAKAEDKENEKQKRPKKYARIFNGTLEQHAEALARLNAMGAGVFVTVQETDLQGRADSNITRIRSVFQEDDGEGKQLPLDPHIIVESSPGKYHRYLLTKDAPLDEFTPVQNRLIQDYGSDPSVKDKSRVMRLPGFHHRKGEPHMVRTIHTSGEQPYQWDEITRALPPITEKGTSKNNRQTEIEQSNDVLQVLKIRNMVRSKRKDSAYNIVCPFSDEHTSESGETETVYYPPNTGGFKTENFKCMHAHCADRTVNDYREKIGLSSAPPLIDFDEIDTNAKQRLHAELHKLPAFPAALVSLPHGLSAIQDYIHGRMIYPSLPTAGLTALAVMTCFAQRKITINSFSGLGLNEQYMVLGTTTFGKEDLRSAIASIVSDVTEKMGLDALAIAPNISTLAWSAPASQQGLHVLLEEDNALFFMSDEFAEWMRDTASSSHKQQALGYTMQLYTKALSTVAPPHAVTNKYQPVKNPRVSILATSTAEAMLETMTLNHAESGAYNRWVFYVAEQERLEKRYQGQRYQLPTEVIELLAWVQSLPDTMMNFSSEAWQVYMDIDSDTIEPMKYERGELAGRLSEQAIKMAALIALSDRRTTIDAGDMVTAYQIRIALHERTEKLITQAGAMSGKHKTTQALEQVEALLMRRDYVRKSEFKVYSRKFQELSIPEQQAVLASLESSGAFEVVPGHKALVKSNLYRDAV